MRKRGRAVAIAMALLGSATLVAGAQAQGATSSVLYGFGTQGGKVVSEANLPVAVKGQLTVTFHGDPATGCAAFGRCAYSGTIVVRPTSGSFAVVTYRRRGETGYLVQLAFPPPESGYTTAAVVQRSSPGVQGGTCADAQPSDFSVSPTQPVHGGSVKITLLGPGGSLLSTRCAGPLDRDLETASPTATVPLRTLERGRISINLSGTRPFAAHGFAGTITSTVVLKLGKPQPSNPNPTFPPGIKTARTRTVIEKLGLAQISGGFDTRISGSGDPVVCRLLDTCGLAGTLTLTRAPQNVSAEVVAVGKASLPYGDFLTALGRRPGPRPRGISVQLFLTWGGHVTTQVTQSGLTCTDTAADGGFAGALAIPAGSEKLTGTVSSAGSWRTRCPGPSLTNEVPLLSASAPAGVLRHPRLKITLRAGAPFGDDGYVASPGGRLSLVLRRGRISQVVAVLPTG